MCPLLLGVSAGGVVPPKTPQPLPASSRLPPQVTGQAPPSPARQLQRSWVLRPLTATRSRAPRAPRVQPGFTSASNNPRPNIRRLHGAAVTDRRRAPRAPDCAQPTHRSTVDRDSAGEGQDL